MKERFETFKTKYSYVWEAQTRAIYLVGAGGVMVGFAGIVLYDQLKTIKGVAELSTDLLLTGAKDYVLDDGNILRVALIKK